MGGLQHHPNLPRVNPETEGIKGWSPLEIAASLDNPGIFSTVAEFTEDKTLVKLNRLMISINIEETGPSKDFEELLLTIPVEEVINAEKG